MKNHSLWAGDRRNCVEECNNFNHDEIAISVEKSYKFPHAIKVNFNQFVISCGYATNTLHAVLTLDEESHDSEISQYLITSLLQSCIDSSVSSHFK